MQSKTSCFNKTIFRKHVTRFWPVWGVYLAAWLLEMPVALLSRRQSLSALGTNAPMSVQQAVLGGIDFGVVLSFFFAAIMAMAVWSFLYNSRSASGAACLPVTRTAQFWSGALAGLLPLLAAHVLTFLLTALAELSLGLLHLPSLLTWLGASVLNLLFFYGFATLCAMLTGNIIVLPAVYAVLNFVAAGLVVLINGIADYFVYGLLGFDGGWMTWLSPAVHMFRELESVTAYSPELDAWMTVGWRYTGWLASGIYAAVGVGLLFAALALLRRRRMESAGDVVAVQVLKPVFRWCMGLCAGLCFADMMLYVFNLSGGTQGTVFLSTAVWLVIGAFLGWFIAEMLIRRSFRVFRGGWRGFGGWALCCAVLLLGLSATELDLFGIERRVPHADRIETVLVYCNGESAYLDDSEGIAQAIELHRDIIAHKAQQDQCSYRDFFSQDMAGEYQTVDCNIHYLLTGGGQMTRSYRLPHRIDDIGDDAETLQALLNSPEAVQNRKETPFEFTPDNVSYGSISAVMPARDCAAAAGYDDPETYVLVELGGYSHSAVEALPADRRAAMLRETLADWRYLDTGYNGMAYDKYYSEKYGGYIESPALPETDGGIDWDKIWLNYTLELNRQEAWELYESCVLPDIADNALGRIWVLQGSDYAATVCAAGVEVDARWPDENERRTPELVYDGTPGTLPTAVAEDGTRYYGFSTTPTVDSARTNDFFEAHGLHLYTVAEARASAK
jgi:ABC-2 type transport system permease protein